MSCASSVLALSLLASSPSELTPPPALPVDRPELAGVPQPPRGSTMFGFGVFGVSFGLANMATGVGVIIGDPGDGGFTGMYPLVFGASFVALGAVGIHYGRRRRALYRDWQLANGQVPNWITSRHFPDAPPTGLGMLISGAVGVAVGATMLPYTVDNLDSSTSRWRNEGIGLTTMASLALASGAPLLIAGSIRLHRRNRWQAQLRDAYRDTVVVPTAFVRPGGAGIGAVGRF